MTTKICSICKTELPLDKQHFQLNGKDLNGNQVWRNACKKCSSIREKKRFTRPEIKLKKHLYDISEERKEIHREDMRRYREAGKYK